MTLDAFDWRDEHVFTDKDRVYVVMNDDFWTDDFSMAEIPEMRPYRIDAYHEDGALLWRSDVIPSFSLTPPSILGNDGKSLYVSDSSGDIHALDLETGKASWKTRMKAKFEQNPRHTGRRFQFKYSENSEKIILYYFSNYRWYLAAYDRNTGFEYFLTSDKNLVFDADDSFLYYATKSKIDRMDLVLSGDIRKVYLKSYETPDSKTLCEWVGKDCNVQIVHLNIHGDTLVAEYLASGSAGWVKTLVGWNKGDDKIQWQSVVATNLDKEKFCNRYWATNRHVVNHTMFFLDIEKDEIIGMDIRTGKFLWHAPVPPFRPEESYEAYYRFKYRPEDGVSKKNDIYRYAGNVRFYSYENQLILVYLGIRVFEFSMKDTSP